MLLSAEQLSINFGSRQLLQDVDFYLNEGDKTCVIGINGTGKSTFLKVLAGLVQPDSGRISRRPNLLELSWQPACAEGAHRACRYGSSQPVLSAQGCSG